MRAILGVTAVLAVTVLTLSAVAAQDKKEDKNAQSEAMAAMSPKPSPDMEKLKPLVGTWGVTMKFEASEMGPGGEATGTDTVALGPGGLSLVADFKAETGPMGSFSGHGITTWDEQEKIYKAFWVDSMTPGAIAMTGRWEGNNLVFTGEYTQMGKKIAMKQVTSDITPTSNTVAMDVSENGGPMKRVMTFRYTKK